MELRPCLQSLQRLRRRHLKIMLGCIVICFLYGMLFNNLMSLYSPRFIEQKFQGFVATFDVKLANDGCRLTQC